MELEEQEQDYADFYSNVLSDKHYESLAQMNYSQLTDELNRVHKVLAPSTESEKKQVAAFKRKMRKEWRQLCKQAAEKDPMGSEPVLSEVETPLSGAGVVPVLQQQQETLVPEQVAVVAEEEEEAVIQVIDLTGEQEQEEEEEEEEEVPERHVKVEVWEEEVPDNLLVSQFLLGLATGTLMGCGLCLFIMLSILLLRGGASSSGSKVKHSGFLVTINTNRSPPDVPTRNLMTQAMREIITGDMFSRTHFPMMVKFLDGHPRRPSDLKRVTVDYAFEVGGRIKRLHTHILVHVYHTSKIHLDSAYIKHYFTRKLNAALVQAGLPPIGGTGVYVNIRPVGNSYNIMRYLGKSAAL